MWGYPPPPGLLESWGLEEIPARSLSLNDLQVKSLFLNDLARFSRRSRVPQRADARLFSQIGIVKERRQVGLGNPTSRKPRYVERPLREWPPDTQVDPIVADGRLEVCDAAHRMFVMKKGRGQIAGGGAS